MAGYYADVPGQRFAYDLDNTQVKFKDTSNGIVTDQSGSRSLMNDEDGDVWTSPGFNDGNNKEIIFIFPELRNITGYFVSVNNNASGRLVTGAFYYSSDTTDGQNGTWTQAQANWGYTTLTTPAYRTGIDRTINLTNVKGLRFVVRITDTYYGNNILVNFMHIYGSVVSGQNPDRLMFWHPTLSQECDAAFFDWGDISQGSVQTKTFRLKNNSASLSANSITLSASDVSTTMALTFSSDGSTYVSSLSVGTLAAGATSGTLYVKRTVPANETVRLQAARLRATASSWT